MEHIIKQLKRGAKNTRLSATEKADIKSAVFSYVNKHPVNNELFTRPIRSPFQIQNFRNKKSVSVLVIAGLLMGGSVSFAAENTVPGDALFPVKVYVNENVRSVIAVTPKAKAEWDVRLVERRLEEVEKLAVAKDVKPEEQNIAQSNLERYSERMVRSIAKLDDGEDSEDAIVVAGNLAGMLREHEEILLDLHDRDIEIHKASVAETLAGVTATTTADLFMSDAQSLGIIIKHVSKDRKDAEEKHKELERIYKQDDSKDKRGRSKEKIEKLDNKIVDVAQDIVATTTQIVSPMVSPRKQKDSSSDDGDRNDSSEPEIKSQDSD